MFSVYQAMCIGQIIQFFGTKDESNVGLIAALGIIFSSALRSVFTHWEFEGMTVAGMQMRVALSSTIYQKVMKNFYCKNTTKRNSNYSIDETIEGIVRNCDGIFS